MKPTKYATDPMEILSNDDELISMTRQMRFLCVQQLFGHALVGDRVRTLKMTGHHAEATTLASGNELKARVLVQLIDRVEYLIAAGFGLTAALYQSLEEGWLKKIDNFETME
jgi:hypothetical protein